MIQKILSILNSLIRTREVIIDFYKINDNLIITPDDHCGTICIPLNQINCLNKTYIFNSIFQMVNQRDPNFKILHSQVEIEIEFNQFDKCILPNQFLSSQSINTRNQTHYEHAINSY